MELDWDPEETVKVNKQGDLRQLRGIAHLRF
jgi:sulfite reductase (NADPH) flavoprotein alpha-component